MAVVTEANRNRTRSTGAPSVDRKPLTRERILTKAIELADAEGVSELSMRKLARSLGFEVMSLYNHVSNKTDLLEGMTDQVAGEIEHPPPDLPWDEAMRQISRSTKEALTTHRWAAMLWVTTMPGPIRFDLMEWNLATLARADLDEDASHSAFHAINNHVIGYVLQNVLLDFDPEGEWRDRIDDLVSTERHPHVLAHIQQHLSGDHGPSFDYVLDLIVDGIAAKSRS